MARFGEFETAAAQALVELALREDLLNAGDLTCEAVIPPDLQGAAAFVARSDGVLAGLPVAPLVYEKLRRADGAVEFQPVAEDGARLRPGDTIAHVRGSMRIILIAERTILNFLQRLSGVATVTRRYVDLIAGLPVKLLDTRKTTPGWRALEKYAVRCGGGHNHRMGLYDGVMLKDNHLAALARSGREKGVGTLLCEAPSGPSRQKGPDPFFAAGQPSTIREAVETCRRRYGAGVLLEVEVDTLEQFDEALACKPDVVLLDNMKADMLREAVRRRGQTAPGVLLEASGGVNLQTIRAIAETGVDHISVGALTHSAPALDIALDYDNA